MSLKDAIRAYRQSADAWNLATLLDLLHEGGTMGKKADKKALKRAARNDVPYSNSLQDFYSIIAGAYSDAEIERLQRLSTVAKLDS